MKTKLFNTIRVLLSAAVFIVGSFGIIEVLSQHASSFPEYYADSTGLQIICAGLFVIAFLLQLFFEIQLSRRAGYRLHWMQLVFLQICQNGKIKLRLTWRPRLGMLLLPPRTDGTSPYCLRFLNRILPPLLGAVLFSLLTALLWNTSAAYVCLALAAMEGGFVCAIILPRKRDDALRLLWDFHRHPEVLRSWECLLHTSAALDEGKFLADLPETWFPDKPPVLVDNQYVQTHTINGASRLIQLGRFEAAYALLHPLLSLQPAPNTHQVIACTILNGALCEAMADLPPRCLHQLEHPSVKYMTPPHWQNRMLTAKYARTLFLNGDQQEADLLRKEMEAVFPKDDNDWKIVRALEEKGGIAAAILKEET